jgi:hypothetical protein
MECYHNPVLISISLQINGHTNGFFILFVSCFIADVLGIHANGYAMPLLFMDSVRKQKLTANIDCTHLKRLSNTMKIL